MSTKLFNSFAGAYSKASTVATQSINKGHDVARIEVEMTVAAINEIANTPLDLFGKNTMIMFGDKPCMEGKTMHQSMVIYACIEVVKAVLETKGLNPTASLEMVAKGVEVKRKEVVVNELKEDSSRIKGKTEAEMEEMAANDEGGCAGGACKL